MKELVQIINKSSISFIKALGELTILTWHTIVYSFRRPFSYKNLMEQFVRIGFYSLPVVILTALATGMVLALQIGFTMEARLQLIVKIIFPLQDKGTKFHANFFMNLNLN